MENKYVYSFFKDGEFRVWCCVALAGVGVCLVLLHMMIVDGLAVKALRRRQALIAAVPALRVRPHTTGGVEGLALSGIISGKDKPMAVINGQLLKAGDVISGMKVVAISQHGARLCDVVVADKCLQLGL